MFMDAKIRALRERGTTRLVTTDSAAKDLGLSKQRWLRLSRQQGFPKRYKVGRVWCVNPGMLADFLELQNELEKAMSLSDIAKFMHMSHYTAQAVLERGELPKPLGMVKGRPRWTRDAITEWSLERLGGAEPPPEIHESRKPHEARAHHS